MEKSWGRPSGLEGNGERTWGETPGGVSKGSRRTFSSNALLTQLLGRAEALRFAVVTFELLL